MTDEKKDEKVDAKPQEKPATSKLPSLDEFGNMLIKLFTDVKKSVGEIATDYKEKRKDLYEAEATNKAEQPAKAEETDRDTAESEASTDEKPKQAKASTSKKTKKENDAEKE